MYNSITENKKSPSPSISQLDYRKNVLLFVLDSIIALVKFLISPTKLV